MARLPISTWAMPRAHGATGAWAPAQVPTSAVVEDIDAKREFGVRLICAVVPEAGVWTPRTHHAAMAGGPWRRSRTDGQPIAVIRQVHAESHGCTASGRCSSIWGRRGGVNGRHVARYPVARLMWAAGLRGVARPGPVPRTTRPVDDVDRPGDLVNRDVTATGPNQLWAADVPPLRP